MKLAIFWDNFLHYHVARIRAAQDLATTRGHQLYAIALRAASPELPVGGYHGQLNGHVRVLAQISSGAGIYSSLSKRQLLDALDETNPDAVAIIGYEGCVARAALAWCRYHRRGAILMLETQAKDFPRVFWKEWPKSRLVNSYDAVLAGGKMQAEYARQLGTPEDRIFTGYDVVDNDFWTQWADRVRQEPDTWRRHRGLPVRFFLSAGRFIPKKGLLELLNAYASYVRRASGEPWSLVIVGDGVLAPQLRAQTAALDLQKWVHFPGYLAADRMGPVYGLASAFIMPSVFSEQWGLVVNEAMAAGLPVLVSNICGCAPDLVVEGVTGYTFNPGEAEELAALMQKLSGDSVDLHQIGRNARTHIQRYSPTVFAEGLLTAAQKAVEMAHRRRWRFWPSPRFWP